MEMESFCGNAKEEDQGAVALVRDLAKALERVSLPAVWAWATNFEGCVAEPLQTISAILPGSKWSCLLLRIVLQDASCEVAHIYET